MALDFGINAGLVEELHAKYLENPESVDPSFREYFDGAEPVVPARARAPRPEILPLTNGELAKSLAEAFRPSPEAQQREVLAEAAIQARVYKLLNAYRVRGHLFAHIDLLGSPKPAPPELDLRNFDLLPEDLDKPFPTLDLAGMPPVATLREILRCLEETYCRTIGVEYTQVEDPGP